MPWVFSIHHTINVSLVPGAMVFKHDTILPIPPSLLILKVFVSAMRYQVVVNDSLRQNSSGLSSCLNHQPLIRSDQLWLPPPTSSGPYVIQQVHVNGTLTILHSPTVYERIKVCDVCCLLLSSLFCTVCSKNLKIKTIDVLLLN